MVLVICADRYVAGEELEVSAGHSLPPSLEIPANSAPSGEAVGAFGLKVSDPLPGALGPGLRCLSGEIGETCLAGILGPPGRSASRLSTWRRSRLSHCPLLPRGPGLSRMVTMHPSSIRSPSSSMTAFASVWSGPDRFVRIRSIAAVESEKTV